MDRPYSTSADEVLAGQQFALGLLVAAVAFLVAAYALTAADAAGFHAKVLQGEGTRSQQLVVGVLAVGALVQLTAGLLLNALLVTRQRASRIAFESWAAALVITFVALPMATRSTVGVSGSAWAIALPLVAAGIGRAVHRLFPPTD